MTTPTTEQDWTPERAAELLGAPSVEAIEGLAAEDARPFVRAALGRRTAVEREVQRSASRWPHRSWQESARIAALQPAATMAELSRRRAGTQAQSVQRTTCPITGQPGTATNRRVPWGKGTAHLSDRGLAACLAALVRSATDDDTAKATAYLTEAGVIPAPETTKQ